MLAMPMLAPCRALRHHVGRGRCHARWPLSIAAQAAPIAFFPAFLDLAGRRALVVGHGETAARKAGALRRAGAEVVAEPRFDPASLAGCAVAIGAEAAEADLAALSRAAQAAGIPVNIVDRPALCSFITPALVERDPVTIAISTGGTAPVLARRIRARIEALLPAELGALARLLDALKETLRARFADLAQRRAAIERILDGPAADLALAGRMDAALGAAEAAIAGAAPPGMVFLVGAGPGPADLLTLRAHRLLGEADVIVHDRLVSAAVLDLARRDAARVFVGKSAAAHSLPQPDIGALLVRLAGEGKRVVRLKGGDPAVFGHAAEEIAACRAAGIAVEVVPGITAALACAATAQVSLTDPVLARTVVLATGHRSDGALDLDFAALARLGGTLAVYMGLRSLPLLCRGLMAAGSPPETAAALIAEGGGPDARCLAATLATLAECAAGWAGEAPALVLIGPTVALLRDPATVDGQRRPGDGGSGIAA